MTQNADGKLQRALQDLHGVHASPGFTDRVLEGLARRKAKRRLRNQLTLSAATAAVLALMVGALFVNQSGGGLTSEEIAREARLLQQEHAQIRSDLEALSASAREAAPVLYLGGDDDFDLVLDLAPIIAQSAPSATAATSTANPYEL
jgi:hypothetical protein